MARIRGSITDFGGTTLAGRAPVLRIIADQPSTSFENLLSTIPIYVTLDPNTTAFDFSVIASENTRPTVRYRIQYGYIGGGGAFAPMDFPEWNLLVPEGDWYFTELLGIPPTALDVWVGETDDPAYGFWYQPSTTILRR